jgi:hypothetical protein
VGIEGYTNRELKCIALGEASRTFSSSVFSRNPLCLALAGEHNFDLAARKPADVVGLYVDPPAKAIVFCVDAKPSISGARLFEAAERTCLDRADPRLQAARHHDRSARSRPRIIAAHSKRRRRVEFLGFVNSVVAAFPDRELPVILDNLNTHKKNERWLKKNPKVHFHFTPTDPRGSIRSKPGFRSCRASAAISR